MTVRALRQESILRALSGEHEGLTVAEVAAQTGAPPQACSAALQALKRGGYVRGTPVAARSSVWLWYLTGAGARVLAEHERPVVQAKPKPAPKPAAPGREALLRAGECDPLADLLDLRRRWLSLAGDARDAAILLGLPDAAPLADRAAFLERCEAALREVIREALPEGAEASRPPVPR